MKRLLAIGIILLSIGMAISSSSGFNLKEQSIKPLSYGNILYVGGNGTGNYTTIQAAINDANPGDTVFVYDNSSPYYENVGVNKSINLVGEDKETTIINAGGSGDVIYVSASKVFISGFTIQNSGLEWGDGGIIIRSNFTTITSIITSNNWFGINLDFSSNNNIITDNTISNNNYGIRLGYSSDNNTITGNNISSNNNDGIRLWIFCNNNTISNNTISNNGYGIYLRFSSNNNTITSNTISNNNNDGIRLRDSSIKNTITGNNIHSNNDHGIYLRESRSNTITGNTISNNMLGIRLFYSSDNTIIKNNFIDNEQDAYFRITTLSRNRWKQNYWNRPRIFPKLVFGEIEIIEEIFYISWFNIDWHPAKEPYDIGV